MKIDDQIVSVAGVHVYPPRFNVAAVANVAARTHMHGNSFAQSVTARLCKKLVDNVEHVDLSGEGSNEPAIRAYQNIGFESLGIFYAVGMTRITCVTSPEAVLWNDTYPPTEPLSNIPFSAGYNAWYRPYASS